MLLMRKKCEFILLVQAIIVAGLITLGTGNSPRLEVRTKGKNNQSSPSRHFLEHPAHRQTMSAPSTAGTGPTLDGRESLLALRT